MVINRSLLIIFSALLYTHVYLCAQTLPVLRVTVSGSKITSEYKNGQMSLTDTDGSSIELNAKFKTRGATASNYSMKPSFNMKLRTEDYSEEQDTLLLGIRSASSWILDAMAIDRICMRNRVCFNLWNSFSKLPYSTQFDSRNGTAGKFVEVYINNEYYGIYCLSDRINRKLLNLKKVSIADNNEVTIRGAIYKHGTNDIGDQTVPGFYNDYSVYVARARDAWELSEPEDYAREEAWAPLVNAYQNYSYEYVKQKFNLTNVADYTILIMAFRIIDNWGNKNHYFSVKNMQKTDSDSQLIITPWDMDASLGSNYNGQYYGETLKDDWLPADIFKNSIQPFSSCLGKAEFKELLKTRWEEARTTAFSVENVAKELYNYRDLFIQSGAWQRQWNHFQKKNYKPQLVENLTEEIDYIVKWYSNRYQKINEYFGISNGIENITTYPEEDKMYDLQGREITAKPQKGIYIKNGRKFIIP